MRLKRGHINTAKFEPEFGLDPLLDLALVGSEWQFRIEGRASTWQALSPSEVKDFIKKKIACSCIELLVFLHVLKFFN